MKLLLNDVFLYKSKIKKRFPHFNYEITWNLYKKYNSLKKEINYLRKKRNVYSKNISDLNIKDNINIILQVRKKVSLIRDKIKEKTQNLNSCLGKLQDKLYDIPNIADCDVPIGSSDKDNKIIYKWGVKKNFSFKVMSHVKLGAKRREINFDESVLLSGTKFSIIKGAIACLYRAIGQYMLNTHIDNNYCEVYVPYIIKNSLLYNTGQLPRFSKDIFFLKKHNSAIKENLSLIPTSEVSLVNLFQNKILNIKDLPIKLVANTPCFRAEAGSYGKNNRGLIRLHQFDKVELVQLVHPKKSLIALNNVTKNAEYILKKLNLPYRKVLLCTHNMSFSASKTYDIEVWSPIDNCYLEVSSCSNTSTFQSYRVNTFFYEDNKKVFPHIINGSGLAIGRILVLILENFQIERGIVKIPKVLNRYMNGLKYIKHDDNNNKYV